MFIESVLRERREKHKKRRNLHEETGREIGSKTNNKSKRNNIYLYFVLGHRSEQQRECHRLDLRCLPCAAAVALWPTTFRSPPVARVATLPSTRESMIGVPRLKDEIPPGPPDWSNDAPKNCTPQIHGMGP